MTTYSRLVRILIDDYAIAPDAITPDAGLETLGVDSLGVMELLFKIEDTFQVKITTQPSELKTVAELASFIDKLIDEQGSFGQSENVSEKTSV